MERAGDRPVVRGNSECGSENAVLNRSRVRSQRQTLTIFSWGDTNLGQLLMRSPDVFLQSECKIIKREKKIKVGYMPLSLEGRIKRIYIKEHNSLSLGHRLGSLFLTSAAMRSFSGAAILLQRGHATARPVGAVEYRVWGVLSKSVYFSEEISETKTVEGYWREDLVSLKGISGYQKRRAFLKSLGRKFNSLHLKKIYHNDLKASNILVRHRGDATGDPFSLVDLQGLKKCFYLSERRRIKNLAQLNRTLGPFLTNTEKLFLLRAYGEPCFSNRVRKRKLIRKILDETARQIIREKSGLTGKHLLRTLLTTEKYLASPWNQTQQ